MTTNPSDVSARLRRELPGISSPAMGGDNLAVTLASYFEPYVESEELDATDTWKQGAVDQTDEVLDAIHAHYALALDSQSKLLAEREWRDISIKPLEWTTTSRSSTMRRAESVVGNYRVWTFHEAEGWFWDGPGIQMSSRGVVSQEDGCASAQADFEARIRSALAHPSRDRMGDDRLREALAETHRLAADVRDRLSSASHVAPSDIQAIVEASRPFPTAASTRQEGGVMGKLTSEQHRFLMQSIEIGPNGFLVDVLGASETGMAKRLQGLGFLSRDLVMDGRGFNDTYWRVTEAGRAALRKEPSAPGEG